MDNQSTIEKVSPRIHTCEVPGEDAQNQGGDCEFKCAERCGRSPSAQGELRHLEDVRGGEWTGDVW